MADSDAPVLAALSAAWNEIRRRDPEVQHVVFSIQPRRPSWCNTVEWSVPGAVPVLVVSLMDGDRVVTGTELMTWLLHMAAHSVPGGSSVSAEGRFHTMAFRDAAERIGLKAERGVGTQDQAKYALGYARISLEDPAPWRSVINRLDKALETWLAAVPKDDDGIPLVTRQRTRGPVSLACKCTPETLPARDRHTAWPRIIRASEGIAKDGEIRCEYCGELFEIREAPQRRRGSSAATREGGEEQAADRKARGARIRDDIQRFKDRDQAELQRQP
jgi:hypothetical protein